MNLETRLESCSARQASKYDVHFRALYGEGEYYIKMDQARRRWIWIKAGIFTTFSVALNPFLVIKQKKVAVCERRMANKHKEHKHHKLVGYWTRVVVFELLCLLWTTMKTTLLCFHWTALKTLLTSHSRKIGDIIRRGVIYIFLLICVSLLNSSCGHWTVCFYWTMHTKSKTNLNSAEDVTRELHVKVLPVIYHWSVHLSSCS